MAGLPVMAVIAGPTASGKSALAMALADLTPSVVINADSMQVYRDLRVVTARPSQADEERHPHRLFGYIDGADACSAARWAADARVAVGEAHRVGRLPIVVGGTGLYIRTLLDGIAPVPDINSSIRESVRALPVAEAFEALSREDPYAATRLSPADVTRIARALEVVRSTGCTLKAWQAHRVGGISAMVRLVPLILLPPRTWLFTQCDTRFNSMIDAGRDEVAALIARNLDPALPVMRAIGVREIAGRLAKVGDAPTAFLSGALATRQYAKRQYTWFVNQAPETWERVTAQLTCNSISAHAIILRDKALTA